MAEVRVLLDPDDDMQVSVGLLERHDPARGRVVVHPTPGTSSLQAFAHDVLGALGRAVNRLDAEQLAGPAAAWRAVTAWMVTDQIEDLVVLRADRLSAGAWTRVLELGRETGSRVLLVCHTPQIPAHLAAVLAGTGYQLLTGLPQALRGTRPHPRLWPDAAAGAGPDVADLPRFLYPHIRNYRSKAFDQLGPAGFARTDAVYRHGRDAACHWLSTRPGPGAAAVSCQSVQLFLAWLVHDSPSRHHTLARLRGAQAGFRLHGFMLNIPPSQRLLDVLSGPGLNAPLVTAQTAGRIRAGVAHPVIAAGIAAVLVTGVQALALASMPWEALSPENDTLRLTWHPPNRTLVPASQVASRCPRHHRRLPRAGRRAAAPAGRTPLQPLLRPPRLPGGCSPRRRSATSGSRPQPPTARSRCPPSRACRQCGRSGSPAPASSPSEPDSMRSFADDQASTPGR